MDEPRMIPIHRSLNRPHLMLGVERGLILITAMITAMLIFAGGLRPAGLILAGLWWGVSFWGLVRMAKADHQMSAVYQRHIRYRAYYAARGCLYAMLNPVPKSKG